MCSGLGVQALAVNEEKNCRSLHEEEKVLISDTQIQGGSMSYLLPEGKWGMWAVGRCVNRWGKRGRGRASTHKAMQQL